MSLSGGLIQLISKNNEDLILTEEPEIFPFLKMYKKYTNFSIDEVDKNLGSFKKDNEFNIKLNNIGDLLGNMNFVIKIPKKFNKKFRKDTYKNIKIKDALSFKLFNTTYYITTSLEEVTDDIKQNILLITHENLNLNTGIEGGLKDFQINVEGENNIILNKLLSYNIVKISCSHRCNFNEIRQFNNIREKFFLGFTNLIKDREI